MTTTPAKKTESKKALKLEYLELIQAADIPLEINDVPGRPEVQVLGVERTQGPMQQAAEGHFEPTWVNTWKLVLVWR